MIIFITNNEKTWAGCVHYEIIESIIFKYNIIISKKKHKTDQLVLFFEHNNDYKTYLKKKYPRIIFKNIHIYDYKIECTIYPSSYNEIKNRDPKKYFYISHRVYKKFLNMSNIYFLTPLCNNKRYIYANILPYTDKKIKSAVPIYVIQGSIDKSRRNYNLLEKILKFKTNFKYKIKVVGKGKLDAKFNKYNDKLIIKNNLSFSMYHQQFLNCYCIIPLILKQSHPKYYLNTLTSTINYGKAYNLKFLIDIDLQKIYKLNNVEIFNNEDDIVEAFEKTLQKFYKKNV